MQSTLIDAGPLIALFDKADKFHTVTKQFLASHKGILITTWPVITETLHMLDFSVRTQLNFLEWLRRGALSLFELSLSHIDRIAQLTEKYADIPMDFADSSLVVAAEELDLHEIITVDTDFSVYRIFKKVRFKNLLLPEGKH